MKKSKKGPRNERSDRRKTKYDTADLGDLGLEPPQIYRENQQKIISERQKYENKSNTKSKNESLSRNEKREIQTKKRIKRNKLRKVFIWLVCIVAIVSVGAVLSLTVFFHIDTISVSGNTLYTEEEILTHCSIDIGENLFLSDTKSAKQALETGLPYIYYADISRKLPGKIEINITEAVPSYSIQNKDKTFILLDDNFKVLETASKKAQGISIYKAEIKSAVAGVKIEFKNEDTDDCLAKLSSVVKDNGFDEITAIYCNNLSDNYMVYDGRIKFKLGTCQNLEGKVYQALAACEELDKSTPNIKGTISVTGDKSLYFTEE